MNLLLGIVGTTPGSCLGYCGSSQRDALRRIRWALTGVVGFWSSTGIAGDVVDMKTATEAGVGGVTGFARAADWAA